MSATFTVTRDQVISLALRKLGVLELGVTPDATEIANASLSLNLLIKQMSTDGLKLWKVNTVVLPLTSGKTYYSVGPSSAGTMDLVVDKPLKVIQAWIRNTSVTPNIDTPMQILSKQEYNTLGSKFSTGVANSIFWDIKQNYGKMYVYLTPDSATATNYQLHFVCQQPLSDILNPQDIPEFPNEWMNTLVWNLADQLAIEYGVSQDRRAEITAKAENYRTKLEDWDVETTSSFFQPDIRMKTTMFGQP